MIQECIARGVTIGIAAFVMLGSPAAIHGQAAGTRAARPVPRPSEGTASLATSRNLGKAYYEQANYRAALREFEKVVRSRKGTATDFFDLGLCQMQLNDFDAALGSFTTATQMDSGLVAAKYGLAILYKREMRYPDAERELREVIQKDPSDPATLFNLGSVQESQRKYEEALATYDHIIKMGFARAQNFYVVSLFRTFNALLRLKRQDKAQEYLALHQQYRDRLPSIAVAPTALEGGKYGTILLPAQTPASGFVRRTQSVSFADITARIGLTGAGKQASTGDSIAIDDYDADGRADLFLAGNHSRLLHQNTSGGFDDVTQQSGIRAVSTAAVFADYDNSGRASLIIGSKGAIELFRDTGHGFVKATKAALALEPGESVSDLVCFDADNDGLLDFFAATDGPRGGKLFRNNGDGTFSDITEGSGISAGGALRHAVFADFNGDGYIDLLLIGRDRAPRLFLNQGGAKFVEKDLPDVPLSVAASVADLDHDGTTDIVFWTEDGPTIFLNHGDAVFERRSVPHVDGATSGVVVDVDGDGFDDLLVPTRDGKWHWLANEGSGFEEKGVSIPGSTSGIANVVAAGLSPGSLDLVAVSDGSLRVWRRTAPVARWIDVSLRGQKSNTRGLGSVLEFKAGDFYQKVTVTRERTRIYTNSRIKLDVVRVTWPNGIIQNRIGPATNGTITIRESERLASSCPSVYGWDGTRWQYFTDVLGASPLGELAPDGTVMSANSREYVRLPQWIVPRDGKFTFQLTDEMREVDYFDGARMVAVDHDPGEEVYANEIYGGSGSVELYRVPHRRALVSATDDHGRDVRELLVARDGRYLGGFARQRIPGIAEMHSLTLDLGDAARSDHVALWLAGWVFWPDSNGSQALRSQKVQMVGPYLQVRDARGDWKTVIDDMGVPSGTNRTMRVDLSGKFLSSDRRVRIVTNLCVYWDEVFFSTDDTRVSAGFEIEPDTADLHYRGFSTPVSDPLGVRPDRIDYSRRDDIAPWSAVRGFYTRFGDVHELLTSADDRMVVMAPGDEMTVSFPADALPPLPSGKSRQMFLLLDGWAKDNEPNTVTGRDSLPLPYRAMKNYPYEANVPEQPNRRDYEQTYETRPARTLIPPLAPIPRTIEP